MAAYANVPTRPTNSSNALSERFILHFSLGSAVYRINSESTTRHYTQKRKETDSPDVDDSMGPNHKGGYAYQGGRATTARIYSVSCSELKVLLSVYGRKFRGVSLAENDA